MHIPSGEQVDEDDQDGGVTMVIKELGLGKEERNKKLKAKVKLDRTFLV